MRFSILNHLRSASSTRVSADVSRDADELIQLWGHSALARANDLSWREDSGLTHSPAAGHWWRVRREVARRLGQGAEPVADFAA